MAEKTTRELAVEWVDRLNAGTGLNGAWRLQRLDRRSRVRVSPDGSDAGSSDDVERTDLPARIRRFCNGIPWALVDEAIKYLHETAPYTGMVYNGVPIEGRYVPTRTWWQRDEETIVDKGRYVEGTYTLLQDLVDADAADALEYPSGGSCSEEALTEYVWDSFGAPALPSENLGQGWSTSVQAMSRNEDGTFNYAIVRRHALTQHTDRTVTKCDEFETTETETWDNLYGAPGAFVDDTGAPVAVPEPCEDREAGVVVEVSVQENDDCTYKAVVQTTESRRMTSRVARKQTLSERTETVVRRAEDSSDAGYEGGSGGIVKTKSSELRPDGRYDNTVETVSEVSVDDYEVARSKTLRSVKTRWTDRNQPVDPDARTYPLGIGDSISVKRTDGGLYDVTYETTDSESVGEVGRECEKTVFQHSHTVRSNVAAEPGGSADDAGEGFVRRRTVSRTEDGTYDVADAATEEKPVMYASVEFQRSRRGLRRTEVHRNQEDYDSFPVLEPGEQYSARTTDGGRFDVTRSTTDLDSRRMEVQDRRTLLQREHFATWPRDKDFSSDGIPFDGNGTVFERTVRAVDEGGYDVSLRRVDEMPVDDYEVVRSKTLRAVRTRRTHRNQPTDFDVGTRPLDIGDSITVRRTEGGLYDVTIESAAESSVGETGHECQWTRFQHAHTVRSNVVDEPGNEVAPFTDGVIRRRRIARTEEGTYDLEDESTTARSGKWEFKVNLNRLYSFQRWYRNLTESSGDGWTQAAVELFAEDMRRWDRAGRTPSSISASPQKTLNDFGLYDGSITLHASWTAGQAGQFSSDPIDESYAELIFKTNGGFYGSQGRIISGRGKNKLLLKMSNGLLIRTSGGGDYPLDAIKSGGSFDPDTGAIFGTGGYATVSGLHASLTYDNVTQAWSLSYGYTLT